MYLALLKLLAVVQETLILSMLVSLYPSLVVIMATAHGIFAAGNSMQVSSPQSDVPEEDPLTSHLHQMCYIKGGTK